MQNSYIATHISAAIPLYLAIYTACVSEKSIERSLYVKTCFCIIVYILSIVRHTEQLEAISLQEVNSGVDFIRGGGGSHYNVCLTSSQALSDHHSACVFTLCPERERERGRERERENHEFIAMYSYSHTALCSYTVYTMKAKQVLSKQINNAQDTSSKKK